MLTARRAAPIAKILSRRRDRRALPSAKKLGGVPLLSLIFPKATMQYHYEFDGEYGQILRQYSVRLSAAIRLVSLHAVTGDFHGAIGQ